MSHHRCCCEGGACCPVDRRGCCFPQDLELLETRQNTITITRGSEFSSRNDFEGLAEDWEFSVTATAEQFGTPCSWAVTGGQITMSASLTATFNDEVGHHTGSATAALVHHAEHPLFGMPRHAFVVRGGSGFFRSHPSEAPEEFVNVGQMLSTVRCAAAAHAGGIIALEGGPYYDFISRGVLNLVPAQIASSMTCFRGTASHTDAFRTWTAYGFFSDYGLTQAWGYNADPHPGQQHLGEWTSTLSATRTFEACGGGARGSRRGGSGPGGVIGPDDPQVRALIEKQFHPCTGCGG